MLIISKSHDYYDSVAKTTGVDKTIVYKRHERELRLKDAPHTFRVLYERLRDTDNRFLNRWLIDPTSIHDDALYRLQPFLLGFCGRVYPMYWWMRPRRNRGSETVSGFSNDPKYHHKLYKKIFANRRYIAMPLQSNFDKLVEFTNTQPNWTQLFMDLGTPVWVLHKRNPKYRPGVTIDPCLKDIGFEKIVDPYTAYQEIYQFLGGVLGSTERDTVGISDADLAASKGYDKWSFRKLPTKGKGRR